MKVYLLYEQGGSYDDYYCKVRGVFSSQELAEMEKDKIENCYKEWIRELDPFPGFSYKNDSEYELHKDWYIKNSEANSFHSCLIEEAEIDMPIL